LSAVTHEFYVRPRTNSPNVLEAGGFSKVHFQSPAQNRRSSSTGETPEVLEHFARNHDDPHLAAWRHSNRTVGAHGSVGIWHETYIVERANYEAIYSNLPLFGLAKATEQVPAIGRHATASRRLMRGENEPAVPSPE
jgi:fumigallin biosynthesis monooxygenase-like protein